jgi:hypothetical protein
MERRAILYPIPQAYTNRQRWSMACRLSSPRQLTGTTLSLAQIADEKRGGGEHKNAVHKSALTF